MTTHVQEAELGRWKTLVVRSAGNVDLQQPVRAAIDSLGREYLLYSRTLAYQLALNHKEGALAGRVAAGIKGALLIQMDVEVCAEDAIPAEAGGPSFAHASVTRDAA